MESISASQGSQIMSLTLAAQRGIVVTLNPKGGPKRPYKKHILYELAQMFQHLIYLFSYSAFY